MKLKQTVKLSRQMYTRLNHYLKNGTNAVEELHLNSDEDLFSIRASYPDGVEMEVSVFTMTEDVLGSIYLFENGEEIHHEETDDALYEIYEITDSKGRTYELEIEVIEDLEEEPLLIKMMTILPTWSHVLVDGTESAFVANWDSEEEAGTEMAGSLNLNYYVVYAKTLDQAKEKATNHDAAEGWYDCMVHWSDVKAV